MKDYKRSFEKGSKKLNEEKMRKLSEFFEVTTKGYYDNEIIVCTDKCIVLFGNKSDLMILASKMLDRMLKEKVITEKDLDFMIDLVKKEFRKNE